MKKAIAILLSMIMAFAVMPIASAQEVNDSPVIYIIGKTAFYNHEGKSLPVTEGVDLMSLVEECIPYAAKAILLGQWDEYADKLKEVVYPLFDGFGMTPDLEVTGGFNTTWNKLDDKTDKQDLARWEFKYDARLSPLEVADTLNTLIEQVKQQTGADKVNIISRCVGTNYAMAYIYKYQMPIDYAGLDNVVFYDAAMNGLDTIEASFSGDIEVSREAAIAFLNQLDFDISDEEIDELLDRTISMLTETYGVDVAGAFVEKFCDKIKDNFIKDFLMYTLASTPGFWSMCDENYEKAKAYLFGGEGDTETWAKLIEVIDDYHYNVQEHNEDIIYGMLDAGVDVNFVCKYYNYTYPVSGETSDYLSDMQISLYDQSFGATTSTIYTTLGSKYLKKAEENGTAKYISADKQVDASTCLFPDHTWFISNYDHDSFHYKANSFLSYILHTEDVDINSNPEYPQYFIFLDNGNTFAIQTEENCNPNGVTLTDPDENSSGSSFFSRIKSFFNYLVYLIKFLMGKLSTK